MVAKRSQKGFSLVEVLLIVLIVAALATAGFYIWRHEHKKSIPAAAKQASQVTKTSSASQQTKADPYAGWKTYCDEVAKTCFRYPATWTLDANSDQVTVLNPAKSVEVDYISLYAHDSGMLSFLPVSVDDLARPIADLKVVGGIYLPAKEPDYGIVDSSLLSAYPVVAGQVAQFPNALRFTDTFGGSNLSVAFRARPTDPMATQADAQAWYASGDAKTALGILQSLYFNN